jgi:hypothetical protein
MLLTIIVRSADDDTDYIIPAAEVKRIENKRYRQIRSAAADRPIAGRMASDPSPERHE